MERPLFIAVIGENDPSPRLAALAETVGAEIAAAGAVLVCGGLGGTMEAACRGARSRGGITIGILPSARHADANPYVTYAIPTGLGHARNLLVARSAHARDRRRREIRDACPRLPSPRSKDPVIGLETWDLRRSRAGGAADSTRPRPEGSRGAWRSPPPGNGKGTKRGAGSPGRAGRRAGVLGRALRPRTRVRDRADLGRASARPAPPPGAGRPLLEAGCGSGRDALFYAREGFTVTGLDVSAHALRRARERAADTGVSIAFIADDLLVDQPAPGSFDAVVAIHLLHLQPEPVRQAMMNRLWSLARDGGLIALANYATDETGFTTWQSYPERNTRVDPKGKLVHFFDAEDIAALLPPHRFHLLTCDVVDLAEVPDGGPVTHRELLTIARKVRAC